MATTDNRRMKYLDEEPLAPESQPPESQIQKAGYLVTPTVIPADGGAAVPGFEDQERKQALQNYDNLRTEYYRDHRPSGLDLLWDSPWIPFGMGCATFSLVYSFSGRKGNTNFAFKMLNHRLLWGAFTVGGMIFTIFRDKQRENNWVVETAIARRLDIRKEDMYPDLKKKSAKSIRLPLPPLDNDTNAQLNKNK